MAGQQTGREIQQFSAEPWIFLQIAPFSLTHRHVFGKIYTEKIPPVGAVEREGVPS